MVGFVFFSLFAAVSADSIGVGTTTTATITSFSKTKNSGLRIALAGDATGENTDSVLFTITNVKILSSKTDGAYVNITDLTDQANDAFGDIKCYKDAGTTAGDYTMSINIVDDTVKFAVSAATGANIKTMNCIFSNMGVVGPATITTKIEQGSAQAHGGTFDTTPTAAATGNAVVVPTLAVEADVAPTYTSSAGLTVSCTLTAAVTCDYATISADGAVNFKQAETAETAVFTIKDTEFKAATTTATSSITGTAGSAITLPATTAFAVVVPPATINNLETTDMTTATCKVKKITLTLAKGISVVVGFPQAFCDEYYGSSSTVFLSSLLAFSTLF